jgi:two-component system sensor histidine kinase BaeS
MSLQRKLLLSHLAIVALLLAGMVLATALIAPVAFSGEIQRMGGPGGRGPEPRDAEATPSVAGNGQGMMGGFGQGGPISMMSDFMDEYGDTLLDGFRQSLNRVLLLTGIGAALIAAGLSWGISRRIVRSIEDINRASQRIAAGHYEERLAAEGEDELAGLVRNFNRMAEALAETEAMRRQLIADVSHELKTPLATIKGYMEGLQDGVVAPTPETYQRIHREADRLQRLVHDLQELSRAEAAELQLHITTQDGVALATAAAEWLRPQLIDQEIDLTLDLPDPPLSVRADFDRARQVLLNLLGNAIQYTPAGGRVTLSLARVHGMARFSVRDSGVGLSPADRELIFQRFYRVDKSRSRAGGGSGIGLTIARYIVEAHGGQIWAESPGPGQGSTFAFTLSLA